MILQSCCVQHQQQTLFNPDAEGNNCLLGAIGICLQDKDQHDLKRKMRKEIAAYVNTNADTHFYRKEEEGDAAFSFHENFVRDHPSDSWRDTLLELKIEHT